MLFVSVVMQKKQKQKSKNFTKNNFLFYEI